MSDCGSVLRCYVEGTKCVEVAVEAAYSQTV